MEKVRGFAIAATVALCVAGEATAADRPPSQEREGLRHSLSQLAAPLAADARVSIQVESLSTGEPVFSRDPQQLLNIASNVKLFTAAAALGTLGPEHTFATELFVDGNLRRGRARHLYVRGGGDPTLDTERLYGLASALYHLGVRELTGDLVLDESLYDEQRTPRGYEQEDTDFPYMAPTGALSLNANVVGLVISPTVAGGKATLAVDPPNDFVTIDAQGFSARCAGPLWVKSVLEEDVQKLLVSGCLPDMRAITRVWKKVDHPALYFGHAFREVLAQRGIRVRGKVRLAPVPAEARLVHVHQSEPLADLLKKVNKRSLNFAAEMLVKAMGERGHGAPGTFAKGLDVIASYLEREVGLPRGSYLMENGSGLNDSNRFSAAQVNRLLRVLMSKHAYAPEYLASLGIAGVDGTLKNRFGGTAAQGRLRGKTGTLGGVTSLSGLVRAEGGELFAFSFVANDFEGRVAPVRRTLDGLGTVLASVGKPRAEPPTSLLEDPTVGTSVARVQTFLAVGNGGRAHEAEFLRTAWAHETDPAARTAIAESLYRLAPSDYRSGQLLLESLDLDSTQVARLQTVYGRLRLPLPGLDIAARLASGGNADAAATLLALAPALEGGEGVEARLAEALKTVAGHAPQTLLFAFRAASVVERMAASRLLVRSVTEHDRRHPLWAELTKGTAGATPASVVADLLARGELASGPPAPERTPEAKPSPTVSEPAPGERLATPYGG